MNRLKKVICGILAACMMCGLLAGCGSDGIPETGYVHFNTSGGGVWNMYGWMTQDELDWYKENAIDNYQQYYAHKVTDIKVVGNDGKTYVALDNEENELGVRCIAAGVTDYKGRPKYAFSISAPVSRMDDQRVEELAYYVLKMKEEIAGRFSKEQTPEDICR